VDSYDINDYARSSECIGGAIDVLALLNGEMAYFRDTN
jgi:hypothetical protein